MMTRGRGVCLIAGAGPGIGQAVARRFAKEGFTIVAVRRNKDQLQTLTADITNSGKIIRNKPASCHVVNHRG